MRFSTFILEKDIKPIPTLHLHHDILQSHLIENKHSILPIGLLNTNALTSCDTVLIPVQCEYYALEGLTQLLNTIKLTQNHFNKKLSIEGLLLTMLDQRTNLGLEVSQEVRKYFKEKVYKTVIPRNIKLSEAPSAGICIFDYDSSSVGAQAYKELAKEVLSRNG